MREIKFRAWDMKEKKMYDVYMGLSDACPDDMQPIDRVFEWPEIYIPLQYTGLKDKNGVQAHYGDLFRNNEGDILLIEKDVEGVQWRTRLPNKNYEYGTIFQVKKGEVIGNIYENPELLTPKEGAKEE